MSPLAIWLLVRGFAGKLWALWAGLPGPIKAAILIAVAAIVGEMHGAHVERARCAARIEASVKAAEARDAQIIGEAHERAQRQGAEAGARASAIDTEVRAYVDELAKRTAASCSVGNDAVRYNDGLGVHDDGIQPARPDPTAGDGHRAQPRPVPPGKGQR